MSKITESESNYNSLEKMNTLDILSNINKEDKIVAISVEKELLKQAQDGLKNRLKNFIFKKKLTKPHEEIEKIYSIFRTSTSIN